MTALELDSAPGVHTVRAGGYVLQVRGDSAYLADPAGRIWSRLRLLAGVHRVDCADESYANGAPRVTRGTADGADVVDVELACRSTAWSAKRVRLRCLDDRVEPLGGVRGLARRVLSRLPSLLVPVGEPSYRRCSLWTDLVLIRFLRSLRTGLLITTRPSLNLAAAVFAPPEVRTVGQEHLNLGCHRPAVRRRVLRRYGRLDAVVTLTATDLAGYRRELPDARRLVCIPNALPELSGGPADPGARTVVAAGRLVRQKGFDLLLDAWQQVAAEHPGWTLRIFGGGPWRQRLQRRIDRRGLSATAFLMGRSGDLGTQLSRASIFVLSSRYEGRPPVLIEAMSKGLGVVSFDCPTGPRELLTDGVDGLLVKGGDVPALARAIGRMIDDRRLRRRLGAGAAGAAARYSPEAVGAEWDALLDDLASPAPQPTRPRRPVPEKEAASSSPPIGR